MPTTIITEGHPNNSTGNPIIIGAAAGGGALLVLAAAVGYYFYRLRNLSASKQSSEGTSTKSGKRNIFAGYDDILSMTTYQNLQSQSNNAINTQITKILPSMTSLSEFTFSQTALTNAASTDYQSHLP